MSDFINVHSMNHNKYAKNLIGNPGIKVAEWNKYSVFGGGYHIALIFDQNDVCGGVSYEIAY